VRPACSEVGELETFLATRLARPLPGPAAQQRFAPVPFVDGWSPELEPETARRAAVLLLIYPGAGGPAIPLTLRHPNLARHGGQISLPGGAIDPGESAEAAALREAEEEIGIIAGDVRLLGPLSTLWIPMSNFVLSPFVAVTDTKPAFRLHPHEVAELVEVPLARLRDPGSIKWASRDRRGTPTRYPYFAINDHLVWGATGMVLSEFVSLFGADSTLLSESGG